EFVPRDTSTASQPMRYRVPALRDRRLAEDPRGRLRRLGFPPISQWRVTSRPKLSRRQMFCGESEATEHFPDSHRIMDRHSFIAAIQSGIVLACGRFLPDSSIEGKDMQNVTRRLAAFAGAILVAGSVNAASAQDGPLVTADWVIEN